MYSETLDTIKTRMLGNISDSVDKTEGYLVYDNVVATGKEFEKVSSELDLVASKLDISNLTGDELTTRVYEKTGLTRTAATFAKGVLAITGNTTIAIEDVFETANKVQFKATEAKTITGTGTVSIQAIVAGSSGNIPAGQITLMPITIPGVTSVTNTAATVNGFDEESDSALLQRYYEKLREPSTQGNIAYFKSLVKSYTGVGDVKVFPTWNGNNTVKIVIIDSNKQVPSTDLINAVQSYTDPLGDTWGLGYGAAPFGAFTTIAGATGKNINVSFTVDKDTNYSDEQRLTNIQASINAYLKTIAFVDNAIVSYAKIGDAILNSAGVLDYSNLTINGATSNIPISLTSSLCEIPVLGTVTVNV